MFNGLSVDKLKEIKALCSTDLPVTVGSIRRYRQPLQPSHKWTHALAEIGHFEGAVFTLDFAVAMRVEGPKDSWEPPTPRTFVDKLVSAETYLDDLRSQASTRLIPELFTNVGLGWRLPQHYREGELEMIREAGLIQRPDTGKFPSYAEAKAVRGLLSATWDKDEHTRSELDILAKAYRPGISAREWADATIKLLANL